MALAEKEVQKSKPQPLLIKPHAKRSGVQLAGWTPQKTSSSEYGIIFEPDVAIPLPDGTILRGDLYRPKADGQFPTLVAWSGYTKDLQNTGLPLPINEVGIVSYIVGRGYCHLTVNARGTGRSGGDHNIHFSPIEQKDVADTIEWAAAQPWSDGNMGMVGMSYFAAIQYFAAVQKPPHLKAIFPYLGFTDLYRHFVYHGGAFHSKFFAAYYTFVGATQKLSVPPRVRRLLSYIMDRNWIQNRITSFFFKGEDDLPRKMHPEESWMRHFATLAFDEKVDGPFYEEKSVSTMLDRISIPICIGSNWGNVGLHLRGAFQAWHDVKASPMKKLFIGPPDPRWPWSNYQEELLAWYDYHLKGIDNGYQDLPPVRYWLQGAERWREASDWPIPGAIKQRFYLDKRSERNLDDQTLQLQVPEQESSMNFVAIPQAMHYPIELNKYEARVLKYYTEAWGQDTEVTGPIRLHLTLSSTAIDTHIVARVSDVAPDGHIQKLSLGWLQASHRKIDEQLSRPDEVIHEHRVPEALVPGTPVVMEFSLTPTANLFKKGHRLLLEISSSPDLLKVTVFDKFIYFNYDAPPYPARNTIYHGGLDGSYLEIDIRQD